MTPDPSESLAHMSRRCESDPWYLAYDLAAWRDANGLTDAGLAEHLGLDAAGLIRLKMCGSPRRESWAADVAAIVAGVGCDAEALAGILGDRE